MVYLANRIVSIVDDEIDITDLFQDAIGSNIDGISVVSFRPNGSVRTFLPK